MTERYEIQGTTTRQRGTKTQHVVRIKDTITGETTEVTSTKTRRAAIDKANKKVQQLNAGLGHNKPYATIEELLDGFINNYQSRQPATAVTHTINREKILKKIPGKTLLDNITQNTPANQGLTKSELQTLRTAFHQAVQNKRTPTNPVQNSKIIVIDRQDRQPFEYDELEAIFRQLFKNYEQAKGEEGRRIAHQDYMVYAIALCTGMRQAEIGAITANNKLYDNHEWRVEAQLYAHKTPGKNEPTDEQIIKTIKPGKYYLVRPKTENSIRTVPLPQDLELPEDVEDGEFIFRSFRNTYISPRTLSGRWLENIRKTDVRPRPFHTLRHTFTTIAVGDLLIPVPIVKAITGHAKRDITEHYITVKQTQKIQTVEGVYHATVNNYKWPY